MHFMLYLHVVDPWSLHALSKALTYAVARIPYRFSYGHLALQAGSTAWHASMQLRVDGLHRVTLWHTTSIQKKASLSTAGSTYVGDNLSISLAADLGHGGAGAAALP